MQDVLRVPLPRVRVVRPRVAGLVGPVGAVAVLVAADAVAALLVEQDQQRHERPGADAAPDPAPRVLAIALAEVGLAPARQTGRRRPVAPAGSGPEPCGAIAKPSLCPSAPVRCEPWPLGRRRLEHAVGAGHERARSGTWCGRRTGRRRSARRAAHGAQRRRRLAVQAAQRGLDEERGSRRCSRAGCRAGRTRASRRGGRTTAACRA